MSTESEFTAPLAFPVTHVSMVLAATSEEPALRQAGHEAVVAAYWRPAYAHLRCHWRVERADAEDLVQEFFVAVLEREFFRDFDPARSRFRSFLRLCLDRFAAKQRRADDRLKRGGRMEHLSLDFAGAEQGLDALASPGAGEDPFDAEWARVLFDRAIDRLEAECRVAGLEARLEVFRQYDLSPATGVDRPTYRAIGERLGIPATQVTNHLAWARRRLRELLLGELRQQCGSEAEFREEARMLLGSRGP
jgi:RNA polymerase sigma factor (sigma-70 family)